MSVKLKTLQEIAQIANINVETLRLYLSRCNFTKYIKSKKINNRWRNAYLFNDDFKRELCDFLEFKGRYECAKLLIDYKESEDKVNKFLFEENEKLKTDNKKLQENLDIISKQYTNLLKHHNEWLAETKKNIDNYECCIQDLEKENDQLKHFLIDKTF